MTKNDSTLVKNAIEIGALAGQLSPEHQAFVLNTINTLLYSQTVQQVAAEKKPAKRKGGADYD